MLRWERDVPSATRCLPCGAAVLTLLARTLEEVAAECPLVWARVHLVDARAALAPSPKVFLTLVFLYSRSHIHTHTHAYKHTYTHTDMHARTHLGGLGAIRGLVGVSKFHKGRQQQQQEHAE
jgi:hypothetical protein